MEIVRFDDEVAITVTDHGSRFTIGPLTGDASQARVAVLRIPEGGSIGRHPASTRQLLAVLSGSAAVTDGDGVSRTIASGYGALWAPGEVHDVRPSGPGGVTAVCIEGRFDVWATMVSAEIVVSDYDPRWPQWFEVVRERVWPAVEDVAVRIDHVGSTSVPGLAAKPIVDMDVVVASPADVATVIERLQGIGYRWRGDLGVPGREAFAAPAEPAQPRHHLYVVVEDQRAHLDHWLLRDLLREDATARARYAALKRHHAEQADGDMDRYVAAKAGLVAELLSRARAARGLPPVSDWRPDIEGAGSGSPG